MMRNRQERAGFKCEGLPKAVNSFLLLVVLLGLAGKIKPANAQPALDDAQIKPTPPLWAESLYQPESPITPELLRQLQSADSLAEVKEIFGDDFLYFNYEQSPLYLVDFRQIVALHVGDLLLVQFGQRWQPAVVSRVEAEGQIYGFLPSTQGKPALELLLHDPENLRDGWLFKQGQVGADNLILVRDLAAVEAVLAEFGSEFVQRARQSNNPLSPHFSPGVMQWEEKIIEWAERYDLDPNLIATVLDRESDGNPNPDINPNDQHLGLFQITAEAFQSGVDPYNPDNNAHAALSPTVIGANEREMSDWNINGTGRAAESLTDAELQMMIIDIERIALDGELERWAVKDEANRYNAENVHFYLEFALAAFRAEPRLVIEFLRFLGYHGGTQLIKPYDAGLDRINRKAPAVDLWAEYQRNRGLAANINYALGAFYQYLNAQPEMAGDERGVR